MLGWTCRLLPYILQVAAQHTTLHFVLYLRSLALMIPPDLPPHSGHPCYTKEILLYVQTFHNYRISSLPLGILKGLDGIVHIFDNLCWYLDGLGSDFSWT